MTSPVYLVCAVKPWNIAAFRRFTPGLGGTWRLIKDPQDLTIGLLRELRPRYVFFPHWSWRVPADIVREFECVCFHMTDVPYGRGGSPLQNLILRGHAETKLSALRMVDEWDAGPVYLKRSLALDGDAEDIFARAAELIYEMIAEIVVENPVPLPQTGEAVVFPRRTPPESELPKDGTPRSLYDFVRMLDAPTYPKAFLEWGKWRLEFEEARLSDGAVEARVVMREIDQA